MRAIFLFLISFQDVKQYFVFFPLNHTLLCAGMKYNLTTILSVDTEINFIEPPAMIYIIFLVSGKFIFVGPVRINQQIHGSVFTCSQHA